MTRKEIGRLLSLTPVMKSFLEGKSIEVVEKRKYDEDPGGAPWERFRGDSPVFQDEMFLWRTRPEPEFRPWKVHEVPVGACFRLKSAKTMPGSLLLEAIGIGDTVSLNFRVRSITAEEALAEFEWKWPIELASVASNWKTCGVPK